MGHGAGGRTRNIRRLSSYVSYSLITLGWSSWGRERARRKLSEGRTDMGFTLDATHLLEQCHLDAEVLEHIFVDSVELDGLHCEPARQGGRLCRAGTRRLLPAPARRPAHRSPVSRFCTTCTAPLIPDPISFWIS